MNPIGLINGITQGGFPANPADVASGVVAPTAPQVGGTFLEALTEAAGNVVGTLEKSETVSLKALRGEAETRDVVDAVMNAEQSLQAAIAIRDKIVSAYLEVSRMAI